MAKQTFQLDIDRAGAKRALDLIDDARDKLRSFAAETKKADLSQESLGKNIRDSFSSTSRSRLSEAIQNTDKLGKKAKDAAAAYGDVREEIEKIGKAKTADQNFSDVSQRVALAGDAGSNLRAAGSLIPGAGGAVGAAADLFDTVEALPRFKAALAGVPGALQETATALGPTGVGLVGVALVAAAAVTTLNVSLAGSKKELDAATEANKRYYELIGSDTSTEDARAELEKLNKTLENQKAELASIENAFSSGFNSAVQEFGEGGAKILTALGQISNADDTLTARADELRTSIADNEAVVGRLTQAIDGNTFAANDNAAAIQAETAARVAAIQQGIQAQTQYNQLIREGTAEQVQTRIAANLDEQAAIIANIAELQKLAATSEDAQKALDAASARLAQLTAQTGELQTSILPVVAARDAEKNALKEQEQTLKDLAGATKKYNDDVSGIEERANQARASAQEKYNNALVNAAENAAAAAESALKKLEESRGKIAQDFARNEADEYRKASQERSDLVLGAQREEAKAARDHAKELLRIQREAQEQEQDLIDARDFASLFDLRRDTTRKLNEANEQYADERRERLIALNDNLTDLATSYQRERENRLIKYQQDLADAQAQYALERQQIEQKRRKDLADAAASYQKELTLANQKYRAELDARNKAIQAELALINQGGAARIAAEAAIQQALVKQAYAILGSIGGSSSGGGGKITPIASAFGNSLSTGQLSTVNELPGQRERFGGTLLPGGAGLFMPLKSGRVSPGSAGGINVTIPININGGVSNSQQLVGAINAAKPQIKQIVLETVAEAIGA